MSTSDKVEIYTDGGCSGNPGPGGWGALLSYKGKEKELSGYEPETTNNRMELMAVIEALNSLKRACDVIIYTDSKYVLQGATEWMKGWKAKNWTKKGGLKNVDLWQELDSAMQRHSLQWEWVKGHSGNAGNDRADQLAVEAYQREMAE